MIPDKLIDTTAFMFGIDRKELMGKSRVARIVEARQALAWVLRQQNWSLESISELLHRDYTTIIYAVRIVERRAAHDSRFRDRLAVLTAETFAPPIDLLARVAALEARVAALEEKRNGHE